MTKREETKLMRELEGFEKKIAAKRDELREIVNVFEPLLQSVIDAEDELTVAVEALRSARDEIDSAIGTLSQYA